MAVDLDAHQQTAQEVLIGELSYNLPNSASYIVDRRTQSYFTSSAGTYRADGVRTFNITLTGDNVWADLSTLNLSFTVKNTSPIPDAAPARQWLQAKADGPWCLIDRLRVYVSGTLVEDLQWYGRLHEQMYRLSSKSQKWTEASKGFVTRAVDQNNFVRGAIGN